MSGDVCGFTFDHAFPEPEFIDGMAVLVCRRCGAEVFEYEDDEEFCDVCFAGMGSSQHHTDPRCGGADR